MIETIELNQRLAKSIEDALCNIGHTCHEVMALIEGVGCYKVFFVGGELAINTAYFTGTLEDTEVTDFKLVIFDKQGKLCQ